MTKDDVTLIYEAWDEEGSIARLGMRPSADRAIQAALVPPGGDWKCIAVGDPNATVTRTIVWNGTEVALVNPRGDMGDSLEGDIAMGIRATPVMDRALRCIYVLAKDAANLNLIGRVARAAIDYVEQPAPHFVEPEEQDDA